MHDLRKKRRGESDRMIKNYDLLGYVDKRTRFMHLIA